VKLVNQRRVCVCVCARARVRVLEKKNMTIKFSELENLSLT
jgi:hypothetical protein